jgi:hypothetical protein
MLQEKDKNKITVKNNKIKLKKENIYLFYFNRSTLIGNTLFSNKIKEWLPSKRLELLYKATTDGFTATKFHEKCDNKGPTLVVIRSTHGYIFGGYTPLSWESTHTSKNDTEGFIFTLFNPHNIPPTQYPRNLQDSSAIYCNPSLGPVFGNGYDIKIDNNSNEKNGNYIHFTSYTDTTGRGDNTFTGYQHFTTNELEVFSVIPFSSS